jgi:hypothetical protein
MRFSLALVAAFALLLAIPSGARAASEVRSPDGSSAGIVFDPVEIFTGTAATAPKVNTYDLRLYSSLTCELVNDNDDGAAKVVTPTCYREASGTNQTFTYPTMSVNSNAAGRYVFDPRTSAATADTGVTDSPNVPCGFMKMKVAAAEGHAWISCTARR